MSLSERERNQLDRLANKVRTFNEATDGALLAKSVQNIDNISSITTLTDNSGGSANDTVETVGDTSVSDQSTAINNNFADLSAKINEIINTLNG